MSAIFGEILNFFQGSGPEVRLKVYGDEFYDCHEIEEGYSAFYDVDLGFFFSVIGPFFWSISLSAKL